MPVCEVLHTSRAEVTQPHPVCVVANPRPVSGWQPYGGIGALPKIG